MNLGIYRRLPFGLLLAGLISMQASMLHAEQSKESQKALQYIIQQMQESAALLSFAQKALGKIPYFDVPAKVIGSIEATELQVDTLARKLDKTETAIGSVALRQSFQPTSDIALIKERQEWSKVLLGDEKLYNFIKNKLAEFKQTESSLLAYWDKSQRENGSKLFARAEGFYYATLRLLFGDKVNDNRWALEASMLQKMALSSWSLIFYLGMQPVMWQLFDWYSIGKRIPSLPGAFLEGLKSPFLFLIPWRTELTRNGYEDSDPNDPNDKRGAFSARMIIGGPSSFGDLKYFFNTGVENVSAIGFGGMGRWIHRHTPTWAYWDRAHFDANGDFVTTSHSNDPKKMTTLGNIKNEVFASGAALGVTYWKAMYYWDGFKTTLKNIRHILKTMKELHLNTIGIAQCINTAKMLLDQLQKHPILGNSDMVQSMKKTFEDADGDVQKLLKVLRSDTFANSNDNKNAFVYSRGNVLLAHRLMIRVADHFVPLMQGIAHLDALWSMVTMIKEAAQSQHKYCFVEFVDSADALVSLEDAWLPLINNPIPNSISFGGEHPNKIIITGPNGGGKSALLKKLGTLIIMAQSWGFVPAADAKMSIFKRFLSCIHPEEDLEKELSTFMAEKQRADQIKNYVFSHNEPNFKVMLLLDEPFRGTVDAESADRIYGFGKDIAPLKQSIVLIATHVEKPIRLEQDTNGAFANYHVHIEELPDGSFERKFKLKPGVLNWWFNDPAKRSRFIDYVTMQKYNESLEKADKKK